jgi:NAD(P)-dependent dehydrogenase (short-subunit alcohol dehydrogenase family)
MELGLRERVVVVTGATQGIGAAIAEMLGAEGSRVALTYHSNERKAEEIAERVSAAGGEALVLRMALEQPQTIEAAFAETVERWGGIDALVAKAVQWPTARAPAGRAEGLALEHWQQGLRANLEGTIATVLAALPTMRERDWGRIVLISSGVAEEGVPGPGPYGVAKAGVQGLMRQLAWDVGRDRILVNAIGAGFTVTERNLETFRDELREQVAAMTPSRRLSSPSEVASLALFLASPANANISGEVIHEGSSTGRSGHVMKVGGG